MKIQFVNESEFQNEGKWYFYIDSTISLDSNDSLAGTSDFSVEVDIENGSDSDYSHDASESCESDTDSEYVLKPSTSAGNGRVSRLGAISQSLLKLMPKSRRLYIASGRGILNIQQPSTRSAIIIETLSLPTSDRGCTMCGRLGTQISVSV